MIAGSAVSLLVLAVASFNVERLMPVVHEFSIRFQSSALFDQIANLLAGA